MRKSALILAALLAVCFTLTGAEAAKKRAAKSTVQPDPAYEWNLKNMGPMAAPDAAKPAKAAKKAKGSKKMAKKKS